MTREHPQRHWCQADDCNYLPTMSLAHDDDEACGDENPAMASEIQPLGYEVPRVEDDHEKADDGASQNRASGPGNRSYECLTADGEWQPTPEVPVELRAADLVAAPKEPTSEHTEWLVLDPLLKYLVLSRQCCTAWLS